MIMIVEGCNRTQGVMSKSCSAEDASEMWEARRRRNLAIKLLRAGDFTHHQH